MTDQNQNPNPTTINPNNDEQNVDIFGGSDDIFENSDILEPIKDTFEAKPEFEENNDVSYVPENNVEDSSFETEENAPVENVDIFENPTKKQYNYEPVRDSYDTIKNSDEIPEMTRDLNEDPVEVEENSDFLESDTIPGFENKEQIEEPQEDILEDMPEIEPIEDTNNIEETLQKKEENNFDILENDEPDFEHSPEIDALDHLDDINIDEINDVEYVEEPIESPVKSEEEIEPINEIAKIPEVVEPIEELNPVEETKNEEVEKVVEDELEPIEELTPIEEEKVEEKIEEVSPIEETMEEEIEEDVKNELEPEKEKSEIEKEKEKWIQRETSVEVDENKSDLQKKFYELIRETKNVHELVKKDLSEWFDVLGGNDDRQKTTYKIFVWDEFANIEKTELTKASDNKEIHSLTFELNNDSLKINIGNEILYDELEDLSDNPNKKMQVSEKLNKFIFLVTEEYKKIEKDKKQKEKRNMIKWIFRNFVF